MTTYTYQKVTFNNVNGWFAIRRIQGVYAGQQFGNTQKKARESFDVVL
jgi:hypothetical protein